MKSELKILQFYQSSAGSGTTGVELTNNLNDSFQQLDTVIPDFIYHDVINTSIEETLNKVDDVDFVIISINHDDLINGQYLPQLNQLLSRVPAAKFFKVLLSPVDEELLPLILKRHIGYSFCNSITGDPLTQKNYWYKLVDLTYDIVHINKEKKRKGTIFLAETIDSFKPVRDQVKRELLRRGYDVFPKETYELEDEQPRDLIYQLLEKSMLAVHIIGSGNADNINKKNVSDKQNQIAAEFCLTNPNLKRIVWLAEKSDEFSEDEYLYIEQLKRDKHVLHGAEIVQIPLEKLKNFVVNRLKNLKRIKERAYEDIKDRKSVYLISDQEDIEKCDELAKRLKEQNFYVIQTDFSVEQIKIFQEHRRNLAQCDGVLIYHSRNNVKWIQMKLLDLRKAPGYGRVSPLLARGLYVEKTLVMGKLSNIEENVLLLSSNSKMNQEKVNDFCKKIEEHA